MGLFNTPTGAQKPKETNTFKQQGNSILSHQYLHNFDNQETMMETAYLLNVLYIVAIPYILFYSIVHLHISDLILRLYVFTNI